MVMASFRIKIPFRQCHSDSANSLPKGWFPRKRTNAKWVLLWRNTEDRYLRWQSVRDVLKLLELRRPCPLLLSP
jgi:hypothetical protein